MKKVRFGELDEVVRSFLAGATQGGGIMVQDDEGRACYGVIPYRVATAEQRDIAWREIEAIIGIG